MKKKCTPVLPGIRHLCLTLVSLFFISSFSFAQTVSGTVSDGGGKPVSGVTVTVKGKQTASTTNTNGQFSINAAGSDVLVFTSIGFAAKEVAVNNASSLTVTLEIETQNLGEVVVTALGITKQSRRLGYAATNVNTDELTVNRSPNVMIPV